MRFSPALSRRGMLALACVAVAGLACSERARLLFEPESVPGAGPITFIDRPETADAIVESGPDYVVAGRSIDPDGVDSVYFEVLGGNELFQPYSPLDPTDTVRFGLPVGTSRHAGDTLLVLIFATDVAGNRGDTAIRRLIVD